MKDNNPARKFGFELPVMRKVCQECDTHNPADAKFCRNCKSSRLTINIIYLKAW